MSNKRALVVIFSTMVFFVVLILKLIDIQISNHEDYDYFAKNQQLLTKTIKAERGFILDRNNDLLAYDRNDISFYADIPLLRKNPHNYQAVIDTFSSIFHKSKKYYSALMSKSRKVCLEKKVPRNKALALTDFIVDGLFWEEDPTRIYSYEDFAAHLLGYVGDGYTGIEGIEKTYNKVLTGVNGKMLVERDVKGRTITIAEDATIEPVHGSSVVLTIDKQYQKILEEELAAGREQFQSRSASGIIMDPFSGDILAFASMPDFNPNKYWEYPDDVRRNRILTDTYEPGSTFKALTLSVVLDQNLCNLDENIITENGDFVFKNVHIRDTHKFEQLSVRQVFEQSSNIGMVKLVQRTNNNSLYKYLRNFGLGNISSIDLPGEAKGKLKKPDQFSKYTLPFIAFGYQVSVTPIQLITAYAAIINGGFLFQPHLLKQIQTRKGEILRKYESKFIRNVISRETSEKMKQLFVSVVENGTAKTAKIENCTIGGKTGTSQQLVDNRYSKQNYNSSFIGFYPADNPKVLCMILMDSPQIGRYGGLAAAPVFRQVLKRIMETDITLMKGQEQNAEQVFEQVFAGKITTDNKYSDMPAKVNPRTKIKIKQKNVMPDLINLPVKDAVALLTEIGLKYKVSGNGKVITQSILPGESIKSGMVCEMRCESKRLSGVKIN